MAHSHLIALPAQELAALLNAANAPQHAALFALVPSFRAALTAPVIDDLLYIAGEARQAISAARDNTQYPEDWDAACERIDTVVEQKKAQKAAQAAAPSLPEPKPWGNRTCPCCAGTRIAAVQSKACDLNWFDIRHLGFAAHGCYMPSDLGIPDGGDGPMLEVCLDCGRVANGVYPLPENVLQERIAKYEEELL